MDQNNIALEFAKLVGEPINYQLPLPVELGEIADFYLADAGEHVWRFTTLDDDVDEIYNVDTTNGVITVVKRSPIGDTELTFKQLNSKLEYVLLSDVLENPDVNVLGRKKEAIARGLDKIELRLLCNAILTDPGVGAGGVPTGASIQEQTIPSGGDLYDVIIAAKQLIEDYGDNYILLAGTNVSKKIDTYDKDKAATFNYNVTLKDRLAKEGIKVVKIFGTVKYTGDSSATALLDANKFIMVARNSRITYGKPIAFVRRKLNPSLAAAMGITVDTAQRGYMAHPAPIMNNISSVASNLWAYGIAAYESIIFAILNPYAIVRSSDLTSIL